MGSGWGSGGGVPEGAPRTSKQCQHSEINNLEGTCFQK